MNRSIEEHAIRYVSPFLLLLYLSLTATAQTWSPAQQEVWDVVNEAHQRITSGDVEGAYELIHPDFVWWNTANDVPGSDFETAKRLDTVFWEHSRKYISLDCVPLTIQVYETFAVVNSYCRGNLEPKEGEELEWKTSRWHHVLKKEGTQWLQVANYGDFNTSRQVLR